MDDQESKKLKAGKALKLFSDPIHGNMRLHPGCMAIIDTPQFQRLRWLKHRGLVYFIYPGASHNRFEHSLGVCHLAGQFVQHLMETQRNLGITEMDLLCVEIAGLCHDLGHGPFSHLFFDHFMHRNDSTTKRKYWQLSVQMLHHLIRENKLMEEGGKLQKCGLTEKDITFIEEMIADPQEKVREGQDWPYKGRGPEKAYLYEIVTNRRNGIDVNQWDNIARDSFQLGIPSNFDHKRLMKFVRVVEWQENIADTNGKESKVSSMQICVKDKELVNVYNMFSTCYILNTTAYQHEIHGALEIMILQVLLKANDHVKVRGKDGRLLRMSECVTENDMEAYAKLNDEIIFKILDYEINEKDGQQVQDLENAQDILNRIFSREFFQCVYRTNTLKPDDLTETDSEKIKQKILSVPPRDINAMIDAESFHVQVAHQNYGIVQGNPLTKVTVYSKSDPNVAKPVEPDEVSRVLAPFSYDELVVRIYSTAPTNKPFKWDSRYKERFEAAGILKASTSTNNPQASENNGHASECHIRG